LLYKDFWKKLHLHVVALRTRPRTPSFYRVDAPLIESSRESSAQFREIAAPRDRDYVDAQIRSAISFRAEKLQESPILYA
jgi:hypothetical protein